MTKEQEEAIKFLELHTNFMGKLDKGRCIRIPEENFTKTKQSIETVLNMLKEKDKEIEKKDKIIDLMAEQLIRVPINKSKRNFEEPNFEEEIIIFADKEYIKQYFERKVEDE